jgi:hypothetical protein
MLTVRFGRLVAVATCAAGVATMDIQAQADEKGKPSVGFTSPLVDGVPYCTIPNISRKGLRMETRALETLNELEPNDLIGQANIIPLSKLNPAVNMLGNNSGNENDYFKVTLNKGDILGIAVLRNGGVLDPIVTLYLPDMSVFLENDDGVAGIFPASNPLPGGVASTDSDTAFIAPISGTYFMRVHPWVSGSGAFSSGDYVLQARWFRNVFESKPVGSKQTIWVDFSGPTINAAALFGGNASANLSPLGSFLGGWGLSAGNLTAVAVAISNEMRAHFDALAVEHPGFDYQLLNSVQNFLPPGTPNVTRIIIGGTIAELGVSTLGIAESIDAGNFATAETAVVLLDLYSAPAPNANSINTLTLDPGFSMIQAVGKVIGETAAHEAGHLLGNWHTDNANGINNIMDRGGVSISVAAGVGNDGILGTADDVSGSFVTDFYANEGVATNPFSKEFSAVRTAFAMSTPVCAVDINGDNAVDGADLGIMLGNWGNSGIGDLNSSGTVDGADLGLLLGGWGPC